MKSSLWRMAAICACLVSISACQTTHSGTRVAAYNIEWFSEDAHPERIQRIKAVIGQVNPDIIALEEVQSRAALEQLFDGSWDIAIKDDPREYQEPALAVKKPYKIEDYDTVFKDASLDYAFPGGRDVLRVVVVSPSGAKTSFYVLHMKSRSGGRTETDPQREQAAGLLAAYIRGHKGERSVVLGDFNDCPDDVSANILESGDLFAEGGRHKAAKPLLVNLAEPLYDKDGVTHGLVEEFKGSVLQPFVPGAKEENEKWRGKIYDYRTDSKIHQTLLDQMMVSPDLAAGGPELRIHVSLEALAGERGTTQRDDDGTAHYTKKGTRASDHLPIYSDLPL